MTDRSSRSFPSRLTFGGAETPDEQAMAALLTRLPAPETPETSAAVERVWRRVITPPTPVPWLSSWSRWLVPALSVAAVAIVGFLVVPGSRWGAAPRAAELTVSSGGVFSSAEHAQHVGRAGVGWQPSRSGEALGETRKLRTDDTGQAVVRIPGVSAVLLGADSEMRVERLAHGTVLRLLRGTLTARVSKRPADEPFTVATAHYTVKVVGTLFTVVAGPLDQTAVSVREGVVDVSDGHGPIHRVQAGARWSSDAPDGATLDETPGAVVTLLEDGLRGRAAAELLGELTAVKEAGPQQGHAPQTSTHRSPEPHPTGSPSVAALPLPSKGAGAPAWTPVEAASPRGNDTNAPPSAAAPTPAESATPEVPVAPAVSGGTAPSATPEASVTDPYAHGLALEASGDAEGAARELGKAADTDPAHGDLALYSLGRLAERRLHDSRRALAAFRRYRADYPRGALLPEVDFEIVKLDAEAHDRAGVLAETAHFLALHPTSDRTPEVHLLRAHALRDEGRCSEALPEYAVVTIPTLADDALYSTAYCQRNLGDRAAAGRTLGEYLRRFPHGVHRADAERAIQSEHEIEN
jgi:outer membrane protein assembly factor BamD (BamD/ComL family)